MEEIERVAITSMIEFLVRPLSGVLLGNKCSGVAG
jgi:hypothetical protein